MLWMPSPGDNGNKCKTDSAEFKPESIPSPFGLTPDLKADDNPKINRKDMIS